MASKVRTCINSEIGKLEAVLIHTPGSELENMTPDNAERSLYSDILNLQIALKEFRQLKGVLNVVSSTFEVKNLLQEILENKDVRTGLVKDVCSLEGVPDAQSLLLSSEADLLARQLIEGVALEKNTLTRYLSNERFLLKPLHNLFFTRDAAMGMNENILIGKMASGVRKRESLIMKAIFKYHPLFEASIIDPMHTSVGGLPNESVSIEGGDFLVAKEDVFIVGAGIRTSTQGIDFLIENLQNRKNGVYQVIVQELPSSPESFIHLDMVFTILDVDTCMV
ncbi:Arginine deiminase, partial [hydrothermal vent metagenome]